MKSQNLVDVLQDDDLSLKLSLTFVDKFFAECENDMGPWEDITKWVVRSNMGRRKCS